MKKPILVVGNWKMHLNTHEASVLVHRLSQSIKTHRSVEVVLAPSLLSLQPLSVEIDRRKFRLSAQDAYFKDEGAFTGEVSFTMLRDLVHYSIIGHSARRIYFGETLETVRDKVQAAVRNEIVPILCIGETKEERNAGETKQVIHDQLTTALANLTSEEIRDLVIAYEPVWAISTFDGEVAKPDDMQRAIDYIRKQVEALYGKQAAREVRVLYGGSVNADDVRAYLSLKDCDGVLVGAASLNHLQFASIVNTAYQLATERE
ncbi:MAG TPA: triose-phosphate isomerase [Candidatus Microsaccharimonas sp.]|nr:triose-phosphate isomerase [Candidatus Microsaccharimonas sp.]